MTRCLAIACLLAALAGAAAPVPADHHLDQPTLLADTPPPGSQPPDPGAGDDPPPQSEPAPAAEGSNAENDSGMTCC